MVLGSAFIARAILLNVAEMAQRIQRLRQRWHYWAEVLGVGVPATFSMAVDLIQARHRGNVVLH